MTIATKHTFHAALQKIQLGDFAAAIIYPDGSGFLCDRDPFYDEPNHENSYPFDAEEKAEIAVDWTGKTTGELRDELFRRGLELRVGEHSREQGLNGYHATFCYANEPQLNWLGCGHGNSKAEAIRNAAFIALGEPQLARHYDVDEFKD